MRKSAHLFGYFHVYATLYIYLRIVGSSSCNSSNHAHFLFSVALNGTAVTSYLSHYP